MFKQGPFGGGFPGMEAGNLMQCRELHRLSDDMEADRPNTCNEADNGREQEPLSS